MKKTAKLLLPVLVLLAVAALFLGLYLSSRPQAAQGQKSVTVEVVHADGSEKTFRYQTDEDYLGPLLLTEGLIEGDMGAYGLYIKKADGEAADYDQNKAYWSLFVGETYATQGIDLTPLTDGGVYGLVYTIG